MNTTEIDYYTELVKFDAKSNLFYAQSFYIVDDEEDFFESWLHDTPEEKVEEYSQSMQIFASADGTGARYAFWFTDGNTDKNKAPIICYGSEGAIVIVAENIKDLIKMLSFGAEGMDGEFYHCENNDDDDDDYNFYQEFLEYTPRHLEFRKWMKNKLNIEPLNLDGIISGEAIGEHDEIEKLQKRARKKLKKSFDKWQSQFYKSEEELEKEYAAECQKKYDKNKAELLEEIALKPTADLFFKLSQNETVLAEVNHEQKEAYLEKALELDENHKESLIKLAEANRFSNSKKAIELYKRVITISDKPEEYYSDIAYCYEELKSYKNALDYYVKDIIATPDGYGCYSQEYIVDICKETKQDAIAILEEITSKVTSANTHLILYKLYYKKKKYSKAVENVLLYITHSDEQAHNYISIAERFFEKELYNEALAIFEKTIDRHDWDDEKMRNYNYICLCAMRLDTSDLDKAYNALIEAYKLDNEEMAVQLNYIWVGSHYLLKGNLDKAEEIFKFSAANHTHSRANAHYFLWDIYQEKNENEKASAQLKEVGNLEPDDEYNIGTYILFVKFDQKDYKKLDTVYQHWIDVLAKRVKWQKDEYVKVLKEYAGFLELYYENPQKSLEVYTKLIEVKPNKKSYQIEKAKILANDLDKPKEALVIYEKLLEKKQSAKNYLNYISTLCLINSDKELIEKLFKEAFEKYPNKKSLAIEYYGYLFNNKETEKLEWLLDNQKIYKGILFELSINLFEKKDYITFKVIIEKLANLFPNNEEALSIYYRLLHYLEASDEKIIPVVKKLIEKTTDETKKEIYKNYLDAKTTNVNLSKYDKIIAKYNNNVDELSKATNEAFVAKDYAKVLALCEAIEKIEPYNSFALSSHTAFLKITKNKKEAILYLKSKLANSPENLDVLLQLISILLEDDKSQDEAKKYLETAKKHHKDNEKVVKLDNYFKVQAITATSIEEFETLLKKHPNETAYLEAYGYFLMEEQDYKRAIEIFEEILKLTPEKYVIMLEISNLCYFDNNIEKGEHYLEKAIVKAPREALMVITKAYPEKIGKALSIAEKEFPNNEEITAMVKQLRELMKYWIDNGN